MRHLEITLLICVIQILKLLLITSAAFLTSWSFLSISCAMLNKRSRVKLPRGWQVASSVINSKRAINWASTLVKDNCSEQHSQLKQGTAASKFWLFRDLFFGRWVAGKIKREKNPSLHYTVQVNIYCNENPFLNTDQPYYDLGSWYRNGRNLLVCHKVSVASLWNRC